MYERSYGARYEEGRGKTTAQIAELIRRDIKAAVTAGDLPGKPVTYSVRTSSGTWTGSIDITVKGWQGDPQVGIDGGLYRRAFTPEAQKVWDTLREIHAAYNHDGSEIMVDYFDVNYYGGVSFEDPRQAVWRAERAAKQAARRAALDAAAEQNTRRVVIYGAARRRTVHDAVTVDGRERLVCGAIPRTVAWDAQGQELTCSRCIKRAQVNA